MKLTSRVMFHVELAFQLAELRRLEVVTLVFIGEDRVSCEELPSEEVNVNWTVPFASVPSS